MNALKSRKAGLKTERQLDKLALARDNNPGERALSKIADEYRPEEWERHGLCMAKGCLKPFEVRRNGHEARHLDGTPFCGNIPK